MNLTIYFSSLLKGCISILNGTCVSAQATATKQFTFQGRKILVTQDVMVVYNFDMMSIFVYIGWEGTTNDSRILFNVLKPENKFPKPIRDN